MAEPIIGSSAKFAQQSVTAGGERTIANARHNTLNQRRVFSIANSATDCVHSWTRISKEWITSGRVRDIFRKTIVDMFGGKDKIPERVKTALRMEDYNQGKPLTSRRIVAVKAASPL